MDDEIRIVFDPADIVFAIGSGALDDDAGARAVAAALVLDAVRNGELGPLVPPDFTVERIIQLCRMLVQIGAVDQDGLTSDGVSRLLSGRPEMN